MKKLSVIIPIYNNEKEIKNTLSPILNNATDDVELILVNDGSSDNSLHIVNEIRQLYPNISIIIHSQEHMGVSVARNRGLSLANGKYIYFCDSDDEIDTTLIRKLLDIISYSPDMVIWEHKIRRKDKEQHLEYSDVNKENLLMEFMKDRFRICMGTFMVKMSILKENGIFFEEECFYGEDLEFIIRIILASSMISVIPEELYTYVRRTTSAMGSYSIRRFDSPQMILRLEQSLTENGIKIGEDEYQFLDTIFFLKQYIYSLESCLMHLHSLEEVYSLWREIDNTYPGLIIQAKRRICRSSYIPNFNSRIKKALFRINHKLYSYLFVARKIRKNEKLN